MEPVRFHITVLVDLQPHCVVNQANTTEVFRSRKNSAYRVTRVGLSRIACLRLAQCLFAEHFSSALIAGCFVSLLDLCSGSGVKTARLDGVVLSLTLKGIMHGTFV